MKKTKLFIISFLFLLASTFAQQKGWFWANPLPQASYLNGVVFTSQDIGYAVGRWGTIVHTSDGVETWSFEYDFSGEKIGKLFDEPLPKGSFSVTWNASGLAGGIYFYQLICGRDQITKKTVVIKMTTNDQCRA